MWVLPYQKKNISEEDKLVTMNSENVEETAQDDQGSKHQQGYPDLSKQGRPQNKVRPLTLTLTLREVLPKSQVPLFVPFLPCFKLILSKPDLDIYKCK